MLFSPFNHLLEYDDLMNVGEKYRVRIVSDLIAKIYYLFTLFNDTFTYRSPTSIFFSS